MDFISEGIVRALELLFTGDRETFSAVLTSLRVSSLSILCGLAIGTPAGFLLGYYEFPGKKQIRAVTDTLLALPTVVVGLFVYGLISRRGPFGEMDLLFTAGGIVIAQVLLILPIVVSLTATAVESLDSRLRLTLKTLGANRWQIVASSLWEARYGVLTAAVTAYGRAVSEVGISMMIGGNIKWHTRTITTAMALESGKGEFAMGIALGLILLALVLVVNASLALFRRMAR